MIHITDEILHSIIEKLPPTFDTHRLIEEVMARNPNDYVRELCEKLNTDDAILQTHAAIGKHLLKMPEIEPAEREVTRNVRGKEVENQGWRKKS
jgi:hypothetical protein